MPLTFVPPDAPFPLAVALGALAPFDLRARWQNLTGTDLSSREGEAAIVRTATGRVFGPRERAALKATPDARVVNGGRVAVIDLLPRHYIGVELERWAEVLYQDYKQRESNIAFPGEPALWNEIERDAKRRRGAKDFALYGADDAVAHHLEMAEDHQLLRYIDRWARALGTWYR
jgi:hypothetical protein